MCVTFGHNEGEGSLIDVALVFKERCTLLLEKDDRKKGDENYSGGSNKHLK